MTISAPLLAVVLLALLVGAAIPVLYQMYQVLRRARAALDTAGPRLERTLDQVGQAASRLDRIGSALETQAQTLKPLFEAASMLRRSIDRSGKWLGTAMTLGGAAGPAVIAGVRAFFSGAEDRQNTDGHSAHRTSNHDSHNKETLHDL
jgi:hypothetical protein